MKLAETDKKIAEHCMLKEKFKERGNILSLIFETLLLKKGKKISQISGEIKVDCGGFNTDPIVLKRTHGFLTF